jgi:predicted DNA-binding transcriptional regulator YafY
MNFGYWKSPHQREFMSENRDNYTRVHEVIQFINRLATTQIGLTHEKIEEIFGWKKRTRERVLQMIASMYPDAWVREIRDDGKVRFRLRRQSIVPVNYIDEQDFAALEIAIEAARDNDLLKKPLENLQHKLSALARMSRAMEMNIEQLTLANGIASAPRPHIKIDAGIVAKLQEAILGFHFVRISYRNTQDKISDALDICPLGFLYGEFNNYLVAAFENTMDNPWTYILHRILSVEILEDTFDARDFNIHDYAAKSFGVWQEEKGGYDVRWLVDKSAAERARLFQFHPTQKIIECENGDLIVEFYADGLLEMARHLVIWEGKIKPIAPKELIDEYRRLLNAAKDAVE